MMRFGTPAARRTIVAVATGGVLLGGATLVIGAVPGKNKPPSLGAKGATLLEDGKRGALFSKDAGTARPMASTTKIMVATVVLDSPDLDLSHVVTVRKRYRAYTLKRHASTADLQTGDKVTVRQLLYASLLPSGADAAYALADTFGSGGTPKERVRSFVGKMNAKADDLRMRKTRYLTFDGSGKDVSTPAELAKLARHAMQNDTFRKVVGTKKIKSDAPAANGRTRTYTWTNTNLLLGEYDGAIGLKTGTTEKAGKCLVFAAERDGKTLVGAVLNSDDRYMDAAKLLDHGFGSDDAKSLDIQEKSADSEKED